MLTLINTNRMQPPIAPLGLDYAAEAVRRAGHPVAVLDLCMARAPDADLAEHFAGSETRLVGLSLRNVDDCFWPSGQSFLPDLVELVQSIRHSTDAPIVLGGVGYSIFARRIVDHTGADFGVHGDGETALVRLLEALEHERRWDRVPGLVYRR